MTTTRYTDEARALTQDAKKALWTIATFKDPDLTDDGLQKKKAEAIAALRPTLAETAATLRTRAEAVAHTSRMTANARRPKIGNDPASLLRTEQRWRQTLTLLESGRSLRDIINAADVDTLLAIDEWAPSYLAAQAPHQASISGAIARALGGEGAPVAVDVSRLTDRRLAELVQGEFAEALAEAEVTEADLAVAEPFIQQAAALAEGRDYPGGSMAVAIDSQAAAAAVAAE